MSMTADEARVRGWLGNQALADLPASGVQYPLDSVSATAAAAYSVRRVRAAWAGSCVRVRRSSDNVEADIGFDAEGWLDQAALAAHVGSSSGFVVTWYDQTGNARHLTHATASRQPRIVNAGTVDVAGRYNRPCLRHDGTGNQLVTSTFSLAQANTVVMAAYIDSWPASAHLWNTAAGIGTNNVTMWSNSGTLSIFAGTIANTGTLVANLLGAVHSLISVFNGASSATRVNDTDQTGLSVGAASISGLTSNGYLSAGSPVLGVANRVMEFMAFTSALSSGDRQTIQYSHNRYLGSASSANAIGRYGVKR